MQDFKFNINKHVHWKKDFDNVSFIDRGEWKGKEGVFRECYWQFECADADGKLVTLNANPAGVNQFIEQLLNFNLLSYAHPAEFVMHQEIEVRKCLKGEIYKAFDDGKMEDERDEDYAYFSCGSDNLTGYWSSSSGMNVVVNQVIVKWYPHTQGRLMALSMDPQQFQVTLHLNQTGYADWLYVMELYRDQYSHFDLFKPRQRIIDKFGESRYFLTDCPAGCDEEQIVHFQVWKDCDIPKIINLLSYPFMYTGWQKKSTDAGTSEGRGNPSSESKIYFPEVGGKVLNAKDFARFVANGGRDPDDEENESHRSNAGMVEGEREERLFIQPSPRGCLELEAVILTCIEGFNELDYLDYQVTCPNSEYEMEVNDFHVKDALCEGKRKRFTQIRFVFLRSENLYLFSAEHDAKNNIIYFYISYAELFKWLDKLRVWQSHYAYLEYEWNVENNMGEKEFVDYHQDGNRSHLVNIRYGHPSWYKFPLMSYLSCFDKGELFGDEPLPGSQGWPQPREYHDEYNVYRCPERAFIIKISPAIPHTFMINPIVTLNLPWWDQ